MSATTTITPHTIFDTKATQELAEKYHLDTENPTSYSVRSDTKVTYDDVQFIVDSLWISQTEYDDNDAPVDLLTEAELLEIEFTY